MNPLVQKLQKFVKLSADDRAFLDRGVVERTRKLAARVDVIQEGDKPNNVYLILTGWACRYKQLEDGRRQIVSFFLPGDMCDLNIFVLSEMDHSIGTLTPVTMVDLPPEFFDEIQENYPRILHAFWWETLVSAAVQREWTMSLGQRSAFERMAHLLCELMFRLGWSGQSRRGSFHFPLKQTDLADAMGLSKVHVNRTLQELRAKGLIELKGKTLMVPDLGRLMEAGHFNPNYLHMTREGHHLDANR